ncbi:hypothetical protein [Asinibacterium sp. OR53]|uniref:hypothetical protein n=1 Tax=Asinibacterium sp. OR53 TaxID=925409 RepID=UPI0012F8544F|nr:hypothetical protein [Asinibacterium sp. OR53]
MEKPENKGLYDLILADTEDNYYCFSEAHIQDLVQDKTDHKLADMAFMETIVANNCWTHDKESMDVRFRTPNQYYRDFHWNVGTDIMTSDDAISTTIREAFRTIPLNWNQFLDTSQLPADFPEDMRAVILEPFTMLDFMEAMLNMSEALSVEQLRFKQLLQYLHRSMGEYALFEKMGIYGYNGKEITDFEAFAESFKKMVYERSTQKDLYNLFIEMQHSLDFFGIVKGKPKKQKFMSLLNDGKHAYYAGHAHILVTRDTDMIAKTELMYKIWDIATMVMTPQQFGEHLAKKKPEFNSVAELFAQFNHAPKLPTFYEKYDLDEAFIQKALPGTYLGYFNTLTIATAGGHTYNYFIQNFPKIGSPILTVELERMVNILVEYFGTDELKNNKFDRKELENGNWKGREWRVGEMGIIFQLKKEMILYFFKTEPKKQKATE